MGCLLLLPFFLIRFALLKRMSREAVSRAAHFPPQLGKAAYWTYQLSTAALVAYLPFLPVWSAPGWLLFGGLAVYGTGLGLLAASVVQFAAPAKDGLRQGGVYRLSRNPMYVSYFLFFLGCAALTHSALLLVFLLLFQLSAHRVILAEEAWCRQNFGEAYRLYARRVRRYL